MTLALWTLFIACLFPIVCGGISKVGNADQIGRAHV